LLIIQFNSIYSCSTISTTGKVTSQIKSCTSLHADIKYKQISMKLDTHYIYIYIYIYINSNHQNITSIKHTLHRPKHKPKHGNLLLLLLFIHSFIHSFVFHYLTEVVEFQKAACLQIECKLSG
jgi:hypothetical protein